jgi:hypothetical protein
MAMNWKGPWKSDATYAQNDVVGYQGSSYIAIVPAPPMGQAPAAGSNWDMVAQGGQPGLTWKGAWIAQSYAVGDAVSYQDGAAYIAAKPVTAEDVPGSSSNWNVLAQVGSTGIPWKGDWLNTTQYHIHDAVAYQGSSYIAHKEPPVGTVPTNPSYWIIMNKAADRAALDIINTVAASASALGTLGSFLLGIARFVAMQKEIATVASAAEVADGKAVAAQTTANTADTTANRAGGKADTAQQTADAANRTATEMKNSINELPAYHRASAHLRRW